MKYTNNICYILVCYKLLEMQTVLCIKTTMQIGQKISKHSIWCGALFMHLNTISTNRQLKTYIQILCKKLSNNN